MQLRGIVTMPVVKSQKPVTCNGTIIETDGWLFMGKEKKSEEQKKGVVDTKRESGGWGSHAAEASQKWQGGSTSPAAEACVSNAKRLEGNRSKRPGGLCKKPEREGCALY